MRELEKKEIVKKMKEDIKEVEKKRRVDDLIKLYNTFKGEKRRKIIEMMNN